MKIIFTISKVVWNKEYPVRLSRDFFPPVNIYIYIFQDFGNVCAGVNGNRNSSPSRERKEVNTGSVKSRGSTVQINLGYGPNTFEDSRRASSSVSQVRRVFLLPSPSDIYCAWKKKKKNKIFEKKEHETEKLIFLLARDNSTSWKPWKTFLLGKFR